jgi:hypothetical protein
MEARQEDKFVSIFISNLSHKKTALSCTRALNYQYVKNSNSIMLFETSRNCGKFSTYGCMKFLFLNMTRIGAFKMIPFLYSAFRISCFIDQTRGILTLHWMFRMVIIPSHQLFASVAISVVSPYSLRMFPQTFIILNEHVYSKCSLYVLQTNLISFIRHNLTTSPNLSWKRTYLNLTPRSWTLLEKQPIMQPHKKIPTFYETRRFITVFTTAPSAPYTQPD